MEACFAKRDFLENPMRIPTCLLGLFLLASCASISVKEKPDVNLAKGEVRPQVIYVRDFTVQMESFKVDRKDAELLEFQKKTVESMSAELLERLGKIYPCQPLAADAPAPTGACWVLEGRFLRVNQGSRALRMFIGFGAGGTKMETAVQVYDLSQANVQPIMSFDTTGGSNAEPGAIASTDPYSAAASAASLAGRGISEDTKRTSRMIVAYVSEYLGKKGWISQEQVKNAKIAK
jgi:hypothetical protein